MSNVGENVGEQDRSRGRRLCARKQDVMRSHRLQVCFWGIVGLLALTGCAARDSVTLHLSKEKIQEQLAARFPIEKRELLFKAVFSDPQVLLRENRIGIEAKTRLEATPDTAVTGRLSLEGDLNYDPNAGELVLTNVHLTEAKLDTVPEKLLPLLKPIGGLTAVQDLFTEICKAVPPRLSNIKLGQLPADWKGNAAKAVLRGVVVQGDGLDIEVGLPR